LKNVGPIRHCKPPHAHSPGVASGTVARRLRIDVHDNDSDNAWQRGPLWPHGMGPISVSYKEWSSVGFISRSAALCCQDDVAIQWWLHHACDCQTDSPPRLCFDRFTSKSNKPPFKQSMDRLHHPAFRYMTWPADSASHLLLKCTWNSSRATAGFLTFAWWCRIML